MTFYVRWTNDIGKIDECKCNSKAKVHFVAVYFISLSIWKYCIALNCIRVSIVSAEFNIEWTLGWEEAPEHFFRRTAITSPDCQEFMV